MKARTSNPSGIPLAVLSAVSLAVWAVEEVSALVPALAPYALWASLGGLALDSCVLGAGLALAVLALADSNSGGFRIRPWTELVSSLPVIALASAPLVYAYLEGRPEALPAYLLAARSLRLLRLRRVLPGSNPALLAILTVCEGMRSAAPAFLPDAARLASSLRLLVVPEALLLLAAASRAEPGMFRSRARREAAAPVGEPVVGRDELAGLLGKKTSW